MIKRFFQSTGIDNAIFWSILNKALNVIKGPISLFFLIKYLTPQAQGLWYTFGSLGTLTIFAELGFLTIITQFVSHDFANLQQKDGIVQGDDIHLDRFFGLIKFSVKFYSLVVPFAILILCFVGYFFFKGESGEIKAAWYIFSIVGGVNLMLSLLQSIYSGLNNIVKVQINLFICTIVTSIANWTMLILKWSLWALVVGNLVGVLLAFYFLFISADQFWMQLIKFQVKNKYYFLKETLPLQGKYAISWISAFFILYLLVPATFKYADKQIAGQLGISIALVMAVSGIPNSWITTKVPLINMYVALKKYKDLDILFNKALLQSLIIQLVLFLFLLLGFYVLGRYTQKYTSRFLEIGDIILIMLPQFPQLIINFYSVYLRAHKEEPLMLAILFQSLLIVICIYFVLRLYNLHLFLIYLNAIYFFIALPLTYMIFKKRSVYFKSI